MSTYRSILLAGAMVVGLASAADAAIFLRASVSSDGGVIYTSIGNASDTATPGSALLVASGLGISVSISIADGNPMLPFAGFSVTGNATSGSANRLLQLEFSQTGVPTASGSNMLKSDFVVWSLPNASSATFSSYVDSGNVAFGVQQLLSEDVFIANDTASEVATFSSLGLTYSQTVKMHIVFPNPNGTFSGGAQLSSPVPEPATLGLLGAGLLGLAFAARRRKAA